MTEAELAVVLGELEVAVVVVDEHSVIRYANELVRRGIGLEASGCGLPTAEQIASRCVDAQGRPLDPLDAPTTQCRESGRAVRGLLIGYRPSEAKPTSWARVSCLPYSGRPGWVIVLAIDITGEIEAEEQAKQMEAAKDDHFQRVTDALPGLLYQRRTWGLGSRYTFLAGPVADILDVSRETLLANPDCPPIHADDRGAIAQALHESAARLGEPVLVDFRVESASGTRWVRQRTVAVQDGGGVLWTGFMTDVTGQHQMEERIQRSQRLDAMSSLAAGVAHNFNNMLAAMIPNLESALERAPAELQCELREAHQAATSASVLVRRLLQAVRGERMDARRLVDAVQVVTGVMAICRGAFGPQVDLRVSLPDVAAPVLASVDMVQQVLLNLCINARDATEKLSYPIVRVRLWTEGEWVRFSVADNGPGISADAMAHLGEPFFTTKPPGQGTGLGLATVYGIVADLGGTVDVQSGALNGTTFSVSLPLVLAAAWADEPSLPPQETRLGRILLVDDEPLVRSALTRVLTRMGHEVVEAASGTEALQRLDGRFDVVLLDLSMPGLSGAATLRRLKLDYPDLPVAIVTGHMDRQVGVELANEVLRKPVGKTHLERFLANVL